MKLNMTVLKAQASKILKTKTLKAIGHTLIAFGALGLVLSVDVYAGTDTTFGTMQTWLTNNVTGSMGKSFAIASLAVGLGVGIVKQSIMSAAVGSGIALAASLGPGIITGIFTATLL